MFPTLRTFGMEIPLYIKTDGREPADLWAQVETGMNAGRTVWLCGEHVRALTRQVGAERDGIYWIELAPRAAAPAWVYRARDIPVSGLALIVLLPLLAILALLVKISSPGPVFHTAAVIGRDKKPFVWRKFRSMSLREQALDDAERSEKFRAFVENKQEGKVLDAARVTRIGRFLRKYSLDELPQLWNVLVGDMTLVGPRPCLPYELEMFPVWANKRFRIKPGLTGVWQIAGRSRVSFIEGLGMDLYYTYTRSFSSDLHLMLQTIGVMVRGKGGE